MARQRGLKRFLAVTVLAATALVAATSPRFAQARAITLPPANATLDEEFTNIRAVRELADGRVLITDDKENRLVVADLKSGVVRSLSRTGKGPGEFSRAGRLYVLRGDSTILRDDEDGRWLILQRDSIVATLTPADGLIRDARGTLLGADSAGNILVRRLAALVDLGQGSRRTDGFAVRFDRSTLRADTVTKLTGSLLQSTSPDKPPFQVVFTISDQALLFPDGWVAVARVAPYRVDWFPPGAAANVGKPLPLSPVKVTDAEKDPWQLRVMRESGTTQRWDISAVPFADVIPAIITGGLLATPDGQLLILRHFSKDAPGPDYDIVNRKGSLTATLHLRETERILGFGRGVVYLAVTDDDGIQRLRRHPWPTR